MPEASDNTRIHVCHCLPAHFWCTTVCFAKNGKIPFL